jgi:hypothetical protein
MGAVSAFYTVSSIGSGGGIGASFQETTSPPCSLRTAGPCSVFRCDIPEGGSIMPTNVSAGTITITGGSPNPIAFSPASDGSYGGFTGTFSFTPGETLMVSAMGATVPAFVTTVVFPSPVTVTSPTGTPTIDHTKDLALTWSGGGNASVRATIQESTADRAVLIACLFSAAAGAATLPAAALSDLEAVRLGSGANQGDLSIYSVGTRTISAGGFPVTVTAGSRAFSALPTVQ